MTTFIPSPEQQAIFDAVLNTKDNVAIVALAGTGKTTSLAELSKRLPATGSKIFCAFNKDIVNELESRLTGTGVKASTFHSIGFSALKKHLNATAITPQGDKYKKLVEAWGNEDGVLALTLSDAVQAYPQEERSEKMRDLRKATLNMFADLLNLARLKLANWDDIDTLESIVWEYALDADVEHDGLIGLVLQNIEHIMKKAEEQTRKLVIDFTDMIYWGVKWNLRFYQYQWVLVDECQDLSPVQREMIARIISPNGGRIILVGDPNQAIYTFAGADSNSFTLSVERWNCKVLPLTMTRRCTTIITQHAARLVSSFRCPDDKPRGKVVWLPEGSLHRYAKVGDMVLSRIKAPLVEQCLNLIGEGIPAMILGADIGKALVDILEKLTKRKDYSFPELLKCLGNYCTEQMDIAKKKGDDARAEAIYDQCEAVKFVISAYPEAQSIDALTEKINSLFGDGKRFSEVVTFATIHKSKGLEAERVFILAPDKLPLRAKNMTPEQEQQEGNLDYVARTRAKHTLVYITNKKFLEKEARPIYVQDDFEDKVWDKPAVILDPATIFRQHFESKLIGLNVGEGFYSEDGLAKAYICPSPNLEEGYTVLIVRRRIYTPESLPIEETITKMWDFNTNIASWTVMPADKWLSINLYERIEPEPIAVEPPIESTETFPSFHTAMSEVLGFIGTTNVLYAPNDDRKMCVSWSNKWHSYIVKTITPDGKESDEIVTHPDDTLHVMKRFQPQATRWQFLTLAEWEEIHPSAPAPEPVVDAVFKPDGLFVEAFTPSSDTEQDFLLNIGKQLETLPNSMGLFAVDGDHKMYVSKHIAEQGMFFVETVNGMYTQEALGDTSTIGKMHAFSPIISTWNTISANDWMFATAQHKTLKERKAEAQSTPLVAPAPLPFASIMKKYLTELLTTYDPDRGLCADGEITTMYITPDWDENYVIYERAYADEDDLRWSRDTKDKSAESVLKKMEALNANPNAWRIVVWGNWIDGIHDQDSTTDEQESPAPVVEPPAVIEASIEQPVIVVDEPPTPSADALLVGMIAKLLRIPESADVLKLAQAIHTASLEHLPNINWETLSGISKLRVAIKRVMREHNYPPTTSGIYMDNVVDDIALFFENGKLPESTAKETTFEAVMTPRIRALVAGSNEGLFCNHETSTIFVHGIIEGKSIFEEYVYASKRCHQVETSNLDLMLPAMKSQNPNPDEWGLISFDDWYKSAVKHARELEDQELESTATPSIEAPQPLDNGEQTVPLSELLVAVIGATAGVPTITLGGKVYDLEKYTEPIIEATQPHVSITPVVDPVPDEKPADITPTFSNGENPPSYQNGKDISPTPTPLPSTAPDVLKTLIEQFRPFALPELDLVLQAIEYIKREKTEGAGV